MQEGDKFNQRFTITKKIVDSFRKLSLDNNPLHTKKTFAQKFGFRERVVYGNILNVFISYFIGECLPIKNILIVSQEIKYRQPIFLNDVLDFKAEIVQIFDSVGIVEINFNFLNKKVLVASGQVQIKIITPKS